MPVDYDLGTARGRIVIDHAQLGTAHAALRSFGLAMTAAGVAAVAGFAYVVKSAADFEKSMDAVQAVSGASRAEMKLLTEQALDLSTQTVYSANEISGAMQALAKAGIPVEDMLDGATQATINLAAAAGDELPGGVERAAEIIANAMKTFNASADEMDHFADVLVGAAASSTVSVEDLAISMRYAGPIASAMGLSIDDLSTSLAILGDRGIKGSTAGTSLRGVLLSLSPTSEKAKNALKDLGLITEDGTNRFFDMNGALKPLPEVMQLLQDATSGLSEEQKIQAFNTIFQRRAMNAAMIMAEQGEEGFLRYAEAIGAIDASDVAAAKLDNLSGDMLILRNSVDALIKRAGAPLQEMFRSVVQGITNFVNKLNELDPNILATIVSIVGIIGVLLTLVGTTALMAGALIRAYAVFKQLGAAVKLLAAAFKLLSLSLLTNPVFLLIAALVALGVALYVAYQRSAEFREAWDRIFERLRPILEAIGGWFQNLWEQLQNLWDVFREGDDVAQGTAEIIDNIFGNTGRLVGPIRTLINWLGQLWRAVVAAFDYWADNVLPVTIAVGKAIVSGIGAAIDWIVNTAVPAIVSFGQAVADVAQAVAGWFNEHVMPVLTAFGALVAAVVNRVIGLWQLVEPAVRAAFQNIGVIISTVLTVARTVIEGFVNAVMIVWNNFGSIIVDVIVNAWNFIRGVIESVLQVIQGIIQVFTGILTLNWSTAWEGIKNIVGGIWNLIKTIITGAINSVKIVIQAALAFIVTIWQLAWNAVKTTLSIAWTVIKALVTAGINTIRGLISTGLNVIKSVWNTVWSAIKSFISTIWNGIKSLVSSAVNAVIDYVKGIPSRTRSALSTLLSTLFNIFTSAWNAVKDTVSSKISEVGGLIAALPGQILGWLGDLGSLLYNAGRDVVQGFIDGIGSMIGSVKDKLGSITSGLTSWKGPPQKDRVILEPVGVMVMQGFIRGIQGQVRPLRRLLEGITPDMASTMQGGFAGGTGGGANVSLTFSFPGVTSAAEVDKIEAALSNSDVLSKLIHATRAGVGAR